MIHADSPRRCGGFTLVELTVAIAITAVLATIAIGLTRDARAATDSANHEAAELAELQQLLAALEADLRAGPHPERCWHVQETGALVRTDGVRSPEVYDLPVASLRFDRSQPVHTATLRLRARRAGRPGTELVVHAMPRSRETDRTAAPPAGASK